MDMAVTRLKRPRVEEILLLHFFRHNRDNIRQVTALDQANPMLRETRRLLEQEQAKRKQDVERHLAERSTLTRKLAIVTGAVPCTARCCFSSPRLSLSPLCRAQT